MSVHLTVNKRNHGHGFNRITLLKVLFFVLVVIVIARLFYLQVWRHNYYVSLAEKRHNKIEQVTPMRGEIYTFDSTANDAAKKLNPIALNQKYYLLYSQPVLIKDATATLDAIEKIVPLEKEEREQITKRLAKDDAYEPLKHFLTLEQKEKISQLKLTGLGFEEETKRIYPQNDLFAHVLGFLGFDSDKRVGQYGLEEYFETYLAGMGGVIIREKDPKGRLIGLEMMTKDPVIDGNSLVLTVDQAIQFQVCNVLKKWVEKMAADDGAAIVVAPDTGQIMALCNAPSFDLNNYSQVESANIYTNRAISEAYEPGSVFKAITMAAALDSGAVAPDTKYVDLGFVKFGPDIIRNAKNKIYGEVDMISVLENSINTGAIFAALKTGQDTFKKYVEKFGFGVKTQIQLPHEAIGNLQTLNLKKDIYTATASYGQGIMATPMQMVMSYAAIANNGILMQPQIIVEKIFENGRIEKIQPQEIRRVISSSAANILKAMLVSVVKNGHAKGAQVPGYYVAGKTGTANIADKKGGYSTDTIHTFIGFAPADKPKFVVLVKITKPRNSTFAEGSVVPAFAEIAKFLLNYYQVQPEY